MKRRPLATRARAYALLACAIAACKPDFGERASLVTAPRLLAVRAEPAEEAPGATVTLTPLVASPDGTVASPEVRWSFCATAKPPSENDVVAAACLSGAVQPVAAGAHATAALPSDGCVLFGPEPPPGARPRDADATGGFYQPVRADVGGASSIALVRLACKLGSASAEAAADLAARYHANQNPTLTLAVPASASPGAHAVLRASWRPEDAEAYVAFDPASQTVRDRREAMRVSWFASAGAFDADHTGQGEGDTATATDDGWTAPDAPGVAHIWVVLRDSRGGVAFAGADILVR